MASAAGPAFSPNWAGKVATGGVFTGVSGNWTVPSVVASQTMESSATWIGIDGTAAPTLIQTGTTSETFAGATSYFAWYEMLPAPPVALGPVVPGDRMAATIQEVAAGTWNISIRDLSLNVGFSNAFAYSTPGQSADWIEEAPFNVALGQVETLADYGSVTFTNMDFSGSSPVVPLTSWFMTDASGQNIISYPSPFDPVTKSFTVTFGSPPVPKPTTRVFGADRVATSVQASQSTFPAAGSAGAAVLANFTAFADALPGVPLAVAKHAPLLLSPGDALDGRVAAELQRALPAGATVYLLGGLAALSPSLAAQVQALGFTVVRYGGATRFQTASIIADQGLGDPTVILEATGLNFPDALAGGAAAAHLGGAILLTIGTTQAPETAAYLAAHPPTTKYALGGPAAAADPAATAVAGADRYQTATLVAALVPAPTVVGVASGTTFADALSGGANIGAAGGPMVLVPPSGPLPAPVQAYLTANKASIASAVVFGGPLAVGDDVVQEVTAAIT